MLTLWSDPRRVGLLVLAVLHVAMAGSIPADVIDPDLSLLHHWLPGGVRVGLWLTAAALAASGAVSRRWTTAGYVAAVLMPVERAVSHLWSWLAWLLPGTPPGDRYGWTAAVVWACIAALISVLAGAARPRAGGRDSDAG